MQLHIHHHYTETEILLFRLSRVNLQVQYSREILHSTKILGKLSGPKSLFLSNIHPTTNTLFLSACKTKQQIQYTYA